MPLSLSKSGRVRLAVKVKPKSSPQGIVGIQDNRMVIRLTSPAVDGQANFALVSFLSKLLRIKKTEVLLVSGEKSRSKLLELSGISFEDARVKLNLPEKEQ
jgi:uncharacterized protein (TIGR00251 family)